MPECMPRSRRFASMAMIASGIAPKPTCSVAAVGDEGIDVCGDAPLELADGR